MHTLARAACAAALALALVAAAPAGCKRSPPKPGSVLVAVSIDAPPGAGLVDADWVYGGAAVMAVTNDAKVWVAESKPGARWTLVEPSPRGALRVVGLGTSAAVVASDVGDLMRYEVKGTYVKESGRLGVEAPQTIRLAVSKGSVILSTVMGDVWRIPPAFDRAEKIESLGKSPLVSTGPRERIALVGDGLIKVIDGKGSRRIDLPEGRPKAPSGVAFLDETMFVVSDLWGVVRVDASNGEIETRMRPTGGVMERLGENGLTAIGPRGPGGLPIEIARGRNMELAGTLPSPKEPILSMRSDPRGTRLLVVTWSRCEIYPVPAW